MAWTPLLVAHVAAAALAIPLGAYNLLRKPRGDRLHRMVGSTWAVLMYWVVASSFWIREINDGSFSWIHALSVLTFVTLSLGLYHALRGNLKAHRANMRGSYFGLLGAFLGAVAVPSREVPQLATRDPGVFAGWVAAVLLLATLVVLGFRLVARPRPSRAPGPAAGPPR